MPLLLADFIYSRDCKLNLQKNIDTTDKTAGKQGACVKYCSQKGFL